VQQRCYHKTQAIVTCEAQVLANPLSKMRGADNVFKSGHIRDSRHIEGVNIRQSDVAQSLDDR